MEIMEPPSLEVLIKAHILKSIDFFGQRPSNLYSLGYNRSFLNYDDLKLQVHWRDAFRILVLLRSFCSTVRYANRRVD